MTKIFETVSFHIVKPCNMSCKFCYATFQDMKIEKQLSKEDCFKILFKLKAAGVQKVTFAGGEPMLYKHLKGAINFAHNIGLVTSIITNGSLITEEFLAEMKGKLDWIGVSIDSLNNQTNKAIGRFYRKHIDYYDLIDMIKSFGFKLKINTVVNKFNEDESMQDFITWANPDRWKIFDTLKVEGQNDEQFDEIGTSFFGFHKFVKNHKHPSMVVEDNLKMKGSYLLIDPQGRFFENSRGKHTYSSPIQNNAISKCLSEINLDRDMFVERGGIYNW